MNSSKYIHYLVRSIPFNWELKVRSKGIWTSRLQLTDESFLDAPFPFPPPKEQTAMIRYLDCMDRRIQRYINAKKKLIKLVAEERELATHDAIRLANGNNIRLGVAVDIVQRPVNRRDEQVYTPIGLYNRGRGIFHKEPTMGADLGDSTFFWIEENELVLSGQFAWEGAVALAGQEERGCVASHRYPVLRGKSNLVESAYLLAFFRTELGHLLLDHHSRGAAGRNRPLNVRTLMKENIPIPPLPMQRHITTIVHLENELCRTVNKIVYFLREFRTHLIADVVTGKLDVREIAASCRMKSKKNSLKIPPNRL